MDNIEKLNALKNYKKFKTHAEFAKFLCIKPQSLSNWYARKSFDVHILCSKMPEIDANWLITGKGSMLRKSEETETKEGKVAALPAAPAAGIPLIPEAAFAGVFRGEIAISPSEYEYYIVPSFRNADFLIRVCGDSMIPRYHSGDIVACKRLALNDLFFQWGKVYILDTNQGALIKKVEQAENPENIRLVSENEAYKPFEIARNSIYHIAIVLGLIRLE